MNKNIKRFLLCTGVLALTLGGCGSKEEPKEEVKEEEKAVLVKNDLYVEPLNPTDLQIRAYNELSTAVQEENYAKEAEMAAVSFALDFFTMSNKSGSEDVGGMSFIPTSMSWEFKEYAQSYYYNNYNYIVNEEGKDALPEVVDYKVSSVTEGIYTYLGEQYNGYDITLQLTYKEDGLEAEDLKTEMVLHMIGINDFKYDRNKVYKDYTDFEGERYNTYKVLGME